MRNNLFIFFLIFSIANTAFADILSDRWFYYKRTFISEDGRVIDIQNNSISHSEGQGYGMLLSVIFDDRDTFNRLWTWTKNNLSVRKSDNLLAWSWGKHYSGKWTVLDYNNASDGDSLVAYSLFLGGIKWGRGDYIEEAKKIVRDIRELLVIKKNSSYYLLPGYYGFHKDELIIINPSYYVLPAYKTFANFDDGIFWTNMYNEALKFLKALNFTQYSLPADWIVIKNGNYLIYSEKSKNYGLEAIRIPLYAIMANELEFLEKFRKYLELIEKIQYVPMNFDLTEEKIALQEGMAMHYIIFSNISKRLGKYELASLLMEKGLKKLEGEKNYYSHTLSLIMLKIEAK